MTEKLTIEQLYALVEPKVRLKGHYARHNTSGKLYIITDVVLREADLSVEVTYRNMGKITVSFTRPVEEFEEKFTVGPHWAEETDG